MEEEGGVQKIAICTSGSRGDVQPYIALALELIKQGHEVAVCTEQRMQGLCEEYGVPYRKIAGDPTSVLFEKESQAMLRDGKIMKIMNKMNEITGKTWNEAVADYEEACKDVDIIVTGPLCTTQTYCIAEKYKKRWAVLILTPTKSADYALPFIKLGSLGFKFLNKLSWNMIFYMLWQNEKKKVNQWRTQHLKLPPLTLSMGPISRVMEDPKIPTIVAINRSVIPFEKRPEDWPSQFKLTGFLYVDPLPQKSEVDLRIVSFIDDHPDLPPIYLGFGSMPAPDPAVLIKLAIALLAEVGGRGVLCAGWSEISELVNPSPTNLITDPDSPISDQKIMIPESLLLIKSVSHTYLFPKCSLIIHHCGIGTCAAALRSGTPSLGCPVMLDQPGNAEQLFKIGVSPAPIPFHQLNLGILVAAVKFALKKPTFKERATYWAEEIAKENGCAAAAHEVLHIPSNQWD